MKKTMITLLALAGVAAADEMSLTLPTTGVDNGGHGWISADAALTNFATNADGGYMFNVGGQVNPDANVKEGVLYVDNNVASVTLAPRTGAGGSGEVILLSGQELNGSSVESLSFDIAGSSCTSSGTVALTLAVITLSGENNDQWVVLGDAAKSTLTLGQSGSVDLTLGSAVTWSDSYKVVAMVDNTAKGLGGGPTPTYTLTGMTVTATYTVSGAPDTPAVPEPATATLGLLALAGLAARRRRK